MAPPPGLIEVPTSVFLPQKMLLSQADIDYQMAHADDFNCAGLNTLTITLMVTVTVAVFLRLLSRRIAKIEFKADDYTLVLGWFLAMGAEACSLNVTFNGGFCRHTYPVTINRHMIEQFGKSGYAWNVLYTTSYPISRISLVLLYRRVFVQSWVRISCWLLIFCYIGYAIGSMVADFCGAFPVAAQWDPSIAVTKQIDGKSLFIANSGFNIATDTILLILPMVVIWGLNRPWGQKVGLSAIFALGVLTVVASVARLVYYYSYDVNDPMWGLPISQYWTIVEVNLGLLCPCLVTFGPLIRSGYLAFSSHLPQSVREIVDRSIGVDTAKQSKFKFGGSGSTTRINDSDGFQQLEAGTYNDSAHLGPTDKSGMAIDQEIALANLDPRVRTRESSGPSKKLMKMGMSTSAFADKTPPPGNVPQQGIGVSRDWRLNSE